MRFLPSHNSAREERCRRWRRGGPTQLHLLPVISVTTSLSLSLSCLSHATHAYADSNTSTLDRILRHSPCQQHTLSTEPQSPADASLARAAHWLTCFFSSAETSKTQAINSQAPKRFFYFLRERRRGRVGCVRVRRSAKPNSAPCRRATLKNLIYWRYATVFSTERLVPSTEALLDCFCWLARRVSSRPKSGVVFILGSSLLYTRNSLTRPQ